MVMFLNKFILIVLMLLVSIVTVLGNPGYVWRLNNDTQPFGKDISIGTTIIDLSNGEVYITLQALESTKTIGTCILDVDLKKTSFKYVSLSQMLVGNDTLNIVTSDKVNDYLEIRGVMWWEDFEDSLANIIEAQVGVDNIKVVSVSGIEEQLELNAVSYYNIKEDIYSPYDITVDSIFAANHYNFVRNEIPTSIGGGAYTTAKRFILGSTELFRNGVLQEPTLDYSESLGTVTFVRSPIAGDRIRVNYKYK